jgi:hypothetical protein
MGERLSPESEAKLVAQVLAMRDLMVVLLANQASTLENPDAFFRRVSNALSRRIDEGDIETAFAELLRSEYDWLLGHARRLCQRDPN